MIRLVHGPLPADALRAAVGGPDLGAIVIFEGTTRDSFEGRRVERLEYEAYEPLAEAELARIVDEIGTRWPGARAAIGHRLGLVPAGEASVIIVVGTPHRGAAYEASRYAIEALKARAPIWKKEIYADGSAWKANTSA